MLAARLASFPRVALGTFPTPLEKLAGLTEMLAGPRLWIKRDDVAELGGSKTRALEFLLGEAKARHAEAVATFGGLQSNFARQLAEAAAPLGLEPHCFYFERRPDPLAGNLLLAEHAGARLHFLPLGSGGGTLTVEQASRLVHLVVRLTPSCRGRRLQFVPVGGRTPVGCLGYVAAAVELDDQLRDRGVERATIVVAAGTGGTLAGLLAGLRLLGSEHDVLGIDVGRLWRAFPASIASLASATCALLGRPWRVSAGEIPIVEGTYAGQGYARDTPAARAAARLVREADGIELDPVYTAKAMAGLVDLVASGKWPEAEHVVFLHTGGVTAEPGARRGASRDR